MSSKIRLAKKEDAGKIALLLRKLEKDYYPGKFTKEYVEKKLASGNDFFVVIERNNTVMGATRLSIVDNDLAEFRFFVVADDMSINFIRFCLNFLKKKKVRKVLMRAKSNDSALMSAFIKAGFLPEGYFKEHYRRKVDIVQFYKFLG